MWRWAAEEGTESEASLRAVGSLINYETVRYLHVFMTVMYPYDYHHHHPVCPFPVQARRYDECYPRAQAMVYRHHMNDHVLIREHQLLTVVCLCRPGGTTSAWRATSRLGCNRR